MRKVTGQVFHPFSTTQTKCHGSVVSFTVSRSKSSILGPRDWLSSEICFVDFLSLSRKCQKSTLK